MSSQVKGSLSRFQRTWLVVFLILLPPATEGEVARGVCPWRSTSLSHQICPLPHMSEASEANDKKYYPWTHKPFCLTMEISGMGKPRVCAYSSSRFNQNGISFITTPETTSTISEIVQNSAAVLQARSRFADGKLPYQVTDLPGKGKGVVATQTIRPLEIFMEDFPALVVDNAFLPTNITKPAGMDQLLNLATDQLLDRERVLSLATSGKDRNIVADVIGTNAFGVDLNGREHKGLYPDIARMNHACDPNAAVHSTPSLSMKAIALRTIAPGEEIVISYIPMGLSWTARARALQRSWRFTCNCALCSAPTKDRIASDRRRERLGQLKSLLQEPTANYRALMRLMEEALSLIKREHLPTTAVEFYVLFMNIYYELGDIVSAIKYGELAYETMLAFDEPDSPLMTEAKENLQRLDSER